MISLDADDFPTGPLGQKALRGKYKNARLLDIQPAPDSIADGIIPNGNYNTQVTTKPLHGVILEILRLLNLLRIFIKHR